MINAALAMYPLSSINEINVYKIRICGKKTITAPTPPIIPSTSIDFNGPSSIELVMKPPSKLIPSSNQSIGY